MEIRSPEIIFHKNDIALKNICLEFNVSAVKKRRDQFGHRNLSSNVNPTPKCSNQEGIMDHND